MYVRNARCMVAIAAATVLSGCVTPSVGPYNTTEISSTDAVVLIGVDSPIALTQVTVPCNPVLNCPYELGAVRRDVVAFPVTVGTKFSIRQIRTMDQRVATIKSEPLTVYQRGIYYYGTIVSTAQRVSIRHAADRRMLLGAKRKFGSRYDSYAAVNFSWPDPSDDPLLGFGYPSSARIQEALRTSAGRPMRLANVAPAKEFSPTCRAGGAISLPDFLPYEEYIRRAFNRELQLAGQLAEGDGGAGLNGALTELAFSTIDGYWKIGLRIAATDGRAVEASITASFPTVFAAAQACPKAEEAFPDAVRQLLEALVPSAAFRELTSGDAGK
jgi:hypothetical protein